MVGTGQDSSRHRVQAQAAMQFEEGDEIYRFVYENVAAGGPVGAPVTASGGTGALTYALSGTDAGSFTINTSTGQILVGKDTALDYESGKTTYRVVVTATDEAERAASADVVVTVDNVNEPPEFNADNIFLELFTVEENSEADINIGDPITAVDPEGGDVTYSLAGANAGLFAVDASSGQVKSKASLNYELASEYVVAFTATDPQSNSASFDVTITVLDDDTEAPGRPAKPSVAPNPGNGHEALKVTWTAPANPGPEITSYLVQYRTEGSSAGWDDSSVSGANLEITLSGLEASTRYEVEVRALNDEGEGPWSETGKGQTLATPPANSTPEFDTGAETALTVAENTPAGTAIGAAFVASDPDSLDTLSYSLSGDDSALFDVGASTGQIAIGAGTTLDYESPADRGRDNVYDVVVQVSDGKDAAGIAATTVDDKIAISITVTDVNERPEFGSTAIAIGIDENTPAATNVGDPLVASDPESDVLIYSLAGADSALFTIDSSTGQISTGDSTDLDHESPSDAGEDNTYDLTVRVSDGEDAAGDPDTSIDDSISVTITVNNVDEPPEFDSTTVELEVAENTVTDTNVGDPITAVDPEGEDVTYSLTGSNAARFDVDASTGQVKTKAAVNYEVANSYSISLNASDPQSNSANIDLTITVTDDDTESPGRPDKPTVAPNTGNGHEALKVTWAAPENSGPAITGYVVQHRTDGSSDSWTQVTAAASDVTAVISNLEPTTAYEVQVRADNAEGEGPWSASGKGETLAKPVSNSPPEFDDGSEAARSIQENARPGAAVGAPFPATDPDQSDTLSYSISGADSALFSVDGSTGQISIGLETALDFESPADTDEDGVYEVTVRVTDGKDSEGSDDTSVDDSISVRITVTNVNERPVFDASTIDLQVAENTLGNTGIGDPITATDPETDALEYTLSGEDSGLFAVDSSTGQISTGSTTWPDYESPGDADGDNVYEVTLHVSDGKDDAGDVDTSVDDAVGVSITVTNLNEPPRFDASAVDLSVAEKTPGNTDIGEAIAGRDPESDDLTYSMVGADARWFEIGTSSGQLKTKAVLDHEAPFDSDVDNVYQFKVWVTDGLNEEGRSSNAVDGSIDVTIRVADVNEPPAFDTSFTALEVDENTATNTGIGSPVAALDPESDGLAYSLAGADSSWFDVDAPSGQIMTKDMLDHESRTDSNGDNVYELTLQVSDGKDEAGNADSAVDAKTTVSITVRNVNEPPEFDSATLDLTVIENTPSGTSVGGPVTARDPESDTLEYALSGVDSGLFEIDSSTGQLRTGDATAFDIEFPTDSNADNVYELKVQVTDGVDGDGNPDDSVDAEVIVMITVTGVNEAPAFDSEAIAFEIAENHLAGADVGDPITASDPESASLTYTLSGADSGLFEIGLESGQVTVATAELDYESPADSDNDNVYEMAVSVTDGADDNGSPDTKVDATISLTIEVIDVNEPPKFDGLYDWFLVEENTPALTNVGEPALAVDPESGELDYSLAGDDADLFDIDASTGQISIGAETELDHESPSDSNGDNLYEMVVQVTDGKNEDGEDDRTIDDETGVIISVTDVREAGDAIALTAQFGVHENAPVSTVVGAPVQAGTPGPAELIYSLDGADATLFAIGPSSGEITTRIEFDFESPADANGDNAYEMVVQITDGRDAEGNADPSIDDEIGVVIRVLDVNEPPAAAAVFDDRTVSETGGVVQFHVSTYFSDPDGDELFYSATSSDPRVASVGIAEATLAIAPAGAGNAVVEVTATDPGELSFSQGFVVTVVAAQGGSGVPFPTFPPVHQGTGGAAGEAPDKGNLLSEREALVVPGALSLLPGETVSMNAIAFNLLGAALPAGTAGLVCTWSSDGGGVFMPNGTGPACTTTFTAPPAGSGNIVVKVTQGRTAAVGLAVYDVTGVETTTTGLGREVTPGLKFPAGVTGSVVWREDGGSVKSPNGLTMHVPAGAIAADYLGVYVREVFPADIILPGNPGFTVGSYAGEFSFMNGDGDPMPGFRAQVPVRICLPITQRDLDAANGGIDGVDVVHVTVDGEYLRLPSDSDLVSMKTCTEVDDFSIYFVGLAVKSPAPVVAHAPAASPTPTPLPMPTPTLSPSPTPTNSATPVPVVDATPVLPSAGDAGPGPRALMLTALAAVAAVAVGVVLLRRTRPARPSR